MKKRFILGLLTGVCLLSTMCLSGCGSSNAAASNVLKVGTNACFAPYEYVDGSGDFAGIDIDIAEEIGRRLDKNVEIMDMDFDNLLTAVTSGKIDCVISGMTVTDERRRIVDFTEPYANAVQSVVVLSNSEYETIDDLSDAIIGVQAGTTGSIYAADSFKHVTEYVNIDDLSVALISHKIDAIIIDDMPAKTIVDSNTEFKLFDSPYADEEYAIAVSKSESELYDLINSTLVDMANDGTLDTIVSKYIK